MDASQRRDRPGRASAPPGENGLRTQASITSEAIRKDIIAGILAPGSKLILRELSERYDVGSIPLREALSRLAMSGLVEAVDQRGFRVADASEEELVDIARVRITIETDALRDAIEHGDLEWEGRVLGAFHQLSRIPMTNPKVRGALNPDWESAHDAYHAALLSACTSKWLIKLAAQLREHSARYRHLSVAYAEAGVRDVLAEHRAMTDAVLARDGDRASRLLAEHLGKTARLATDQGRLRSLRQAAGATKKKDGATRADPAKRRQD